MSYTAIDIAEMLLPPSLAGAESVAERISNSWEPNKADKTLESCLNEALDEFARTISCETGYDWKRKVQAMATEVSLRIKPINP